MALTYVVGRLVPFQTTVEVVLNPVPVTVSTNAWLPATADAGDSDVMVAGAGELRIKTAIPEPEPPGFVTLTISVPAAAVRLAGTVATSCVELVKLVGIWVPFQLTTDPEAKSAPLIVSVSAPEPATAVPGVMEDREGATTSKTDGAEFAVPLLTVRNAVPGVCRSAEPT